MKSIFLFLFVVTLWAATTHGQLQVEEEEEVVEEKSVEREKQDGVSNQELSERPRPRHHPPPPPPHDNGVPPGFEKVLPEETIKKLKELHANTSLRFSEKRKKFEEIMSEVPPEILAKLPLPPDVEKLPEDIQKQIREIQADTSLNWNEKHKKIRKLIRSLPKELKKHFPGRPPWMHRRGPPNFPPTPPPGFKEVLPKEVYDQLLEIHRDRSIGPKEKIRKIDKIMRAQPKKILELLPLPPGFDRLPKEERDKAKAIFIDTSLDFDAKNKKIREFIRSLTPEQQKLVRPPLPRALEKLPVEVKKQVEDIFDDPELDEEERHNKFWKLVSSTLSEDQLAEIKGELGEGSSSNRGRSYSRGHSHSRGSSGSDSRSSRHRDDDN